MSQQHFQFARQGNPIGESPRKAEGKKAEGNGCQVDRGPSKSTQIFNPGELPAPDNTLVLRLAAPCRELGLSAGDLVLVDKSATDPSTLQEYLAIKSEFGGVRLARREELVGSSSTELIGELLLALPGAKGLRYIANLYPIGRGINRRRATS